MGGKSRLAAPQGGVRLKRIWPRGLVKDLVSSKLHVSAHHCALTHRITM